MMKEGPYLEQQWSNDIIITVSKKKSETKERCIADEMIVVMREGAMNLELTPTNILNVVLCTNDRSIQQKCQRLNENKETFYGTILNYK